MLFLTPGKNGADPVPREEKYTISLQHPMSIEFFKMSSFGIVWHRNGPSRDVGFPMKVAVPASPLVFDSSRPQRVPPDTKKHPTLAMAHAKTFEHGMVPFWNRHHQCCQASLLRVSQQESLGQNFRSNPFLVFPVTDCVSRQPFSNAPSSRAVWGMLSTTLPLG